MTLGMRVEEKTATVRPLGNSLVVNNEVYIVRGKIIDNPFSRRIENSEAAFWILSNRTRVEQSIARHFMTTSVFGGNLDDCFNLLLNEFNTRVDLEFNRNYFGKDSGYTVGEYVINRVKHVVQKYKNLLLKEETVPLLTTEESERHGYGVIEEVVGGEKRVEDIVEEDFVYWDGMFNELIYHFTAFLDERHYREMCHERIVTNLYFNVQEFGAQVNVQSHYEQVAEKCSEPVEVIETIMEDMKKAVKERDFHGREILNRVQELIGGKNFGWKPPLLRK